MKTIEEFWNFDEPFNWLKQLCTVLYNSSFFSLFALINCTGRVLFSLGRKILFFHLWSKDQAHSQLMSRSDIQDFGRTFFRPFNWCTFVWSTFLSEHNLDHEIKPWKRWLRCHFWKMSPRCPLYHYHGLRDRALDS